MNRYSTGKLVAWGFVALAAEVTILETFAVGGARPELLLSLACFAALFARDSHQGLLACWGIGLLKDAGSSGPLGLHALLFSVAGWAVLQVRLVLFRESPVTQLAVGFLAACWVNVAGALFVSITAGSIPLAVIAGKTLLSAVLTSALTPPLLFFFSRVRWSVR
jgi:rod shape-determining protein MreD